MWLSCDWARPRMCLFRIKLAGGDDGIRTRDLMRARRLRLGYLVDFAARLATQEHAKARQEHSSGTDLVLVFSAPVLPQKLPEGFTNRLSQPWLETKPRCYRSWGRVPPARAWHPQSPPESSGVSSGLMMAISAPDAPAYSAKPTGG
jgi:hypothetical protein